jgi:hypothetical protein
MFQDLSAYRGRNPFEAGAQGRPSLDALRKISSLKGVGASEVPYGDDEMELAFGGQVDDANAQIDNWSANPIDSFGHLTANPVLERRKLDAMAPQWKGFSDALDRSARMAGNRGMGFRADLVGRGPGSGTGVGRWTAAVGSKNSRGSFNQEGPATDLEDLQFDANNASLGANDRTAAMRALKMLTGGR